MFDKLEGEVFKSINIQGFTHYYVSNVGRVSNGEIIMKLSTNEWGYKRVCLSSLGKPKKFFVHRLVASTFIGEPEQEGLVVNHLNCIRDDNRPENLEWTTVKGNVHHGIEHGEIDLERLKKQASRANKAANLARHRPVRLICLETGASCDYESVIQASILTGLDKRAIGAVARGNRNSHKGYIAVYL